LLTERRASRTAEKKQRTTQPLAVSHRYLHAQAISCILVPHSSPRKQKILCRAFP
jgi:hypothetical protein